MGLLEGSGRGGKRADGTQKEVLQRHVVCQKVERGMDWEGPREVGEGSKVSREVRGGRGGEGVRGMQSGRSNNHKQPETIVIRFFSYL